MDLKKIIDSLLILAIGFLFSSILSLNTSVGDLSKEIAIMQVKNQSTDREREKRSLLLTQLTNIQKQHGERINKIEWKLGDNLGSRNR